MLLLLAGCGGESAPPASPAASTPAAEPTAPAAAAAAADADAASTLIERADRAAAADQLFEPAGDNALELYLRARAAAEGSAQAQGARGRRLLDSMADGGPGVVANPALGDLFPYGLVFAEQALRDGRRAEAERVMALLDQVRKDSPGLARLKSLAAAAANPPAAAPARQQPAPGPLAARPAPALVAAPSTAAPPDAGTPAARPATARPPQPAAAAPGSRGAQPVAPGAPAPAPAAAQPLASVAAAPAATPASATPEPAAQAEAQPAPAQLVSLSPRYPARARRQRIEGWVAVRFRVQPDGSVTEVNVVAAEPEGIFDREAVGAVSRWRFAASATEHWLERRIDFLLDR
jgi:protein TonB